MIMKVLLLAAVLVSLPTPLAAGDSLSLDQSLDQSLDHDALMALARKQWRNKSTQVIASVLQEAEAEAAAHRRRLLAYSKLGKVSTLSFVHIARTGGLSFNKLLVENRGVVGRDGNRIPDCIVPRAAYGNASLPLASRFDFPHCEILSAIWPLPTVQAKLKFKKESVFVTFMRDPPSRIMSQWRSDTHNLPDLFGQCKSFDYLFAKPDRTCLQKGTQPVQYSDFATLMVGGCKWNGDKRACTAPLVFDAPGLVDQFAFVGITEHFDVSVCLFFFTFGDEGKFKRYCKHRTAAAPLTNRAPKVADPFRSMFSPRALSYVWRANRKDSELYWTAYRQFVRSVQVMEAATNVHFISKLFTKGDEYHSLEEPTVRGKQDRNDDGK